MPKKTRIPPKVAEAAARIRERLDAGEHWTTLGGRRLRHKRTVIRFPLPREWRLMAHEEDGGLVVDGVLSHEDYSRGAKPGRRGAR